MENIKQMVVFHSCVNVYQRVAVDVPSFSHDFSMISKWYMVVCQNLVPLVNIKIAGRWMFIPLKMVLRNRYWSIPISTFFSISWSPSWAFASSLPRASLSTCSASRLPWSVSESHRPVNYSTENYDINNQHRENRNTIWVWINTY